jgi:hypothetical protein
MIFGSELGKLKLEHVFNEMVYIAPKVYGGHYINKEGKYKELVRIKGSKNPISFKIIIT